MCRLVLHFVALLTQMRSTAAAAIPYPSRVHRHDIDGGRSGETLRVHTHFSGWIPTHWVTEYSLTFPIDIQVEFGKNYPGQVEFALRCRVLDLE